MQVFNNLSLREKLIISFATLALVVLTLHAFVWQALIDDGINYQQRLAQQQDDLLWVQQNIGQLKNPSAKAKKINGSLISWLDLQINHYQLKNNLKRIKPRGDHRVKIWLEEADAKNLMELLSGISQYSVNIEEIKLVALEKAGIINASIILAMQQQ